MTDLKAATDLIAGALENDWKSQCLCQVHARDGSHLMACLRRQEDDGLADDLKTGRIRLIDGERLAALEEAARQLQALRDGKGDAKSVTAALARPSATEGK